MPDVIPISARMQSRFRGGDILAFYGRDWQSRFISAVTAGPSHVGIVVEWPMPAAHGGYDTELVLIESTTQCPRPCLLQGELFNGVQAQDPWKRVGDYRGQAKLFRLHEFRELTPEGQDDLSEIAAKFIGKPYDYRGAMWSGTRVLKYMLPYADLGSLFCSELIAVCLQTIGKLCVTSPGDYNPGSLVRTLVKTGVYLPGVPV